MRWVGELRVRWVWSIGVALGVPLLWVVAEEKVGFEPMCLVAIVNGLQ